MYSQRTAFGPRWYADVVSQRRHLRSAACADPVLRAAFPDEYKPAAPAEDDDDDDDDEHASANRSKAEERQPADAVDAKPKDEL